MSIYNAVNLTDKRTKKQIFNLFRIDSQLYVLVCFGMITLRDIDVKDKHIYPKT